MENPTRETQAFPTRSFPYRKGGGCPGMAALGGVMGADGQAQAQASLTPDTLHRNVVGLDDGEQMMPRALTPGELEQLADPMGLLLRSGKPFPLTARALLLAIDGLADPGHALPRQLVFLVADGGHIPWSQETDKLERSFRFTIARGSAAGSAGFSLLISCSTTLDSKEAFLQVIGWDSTHEVFHFYERKWGTFLWAGQSTHALEEDSTRGKGPFDSHVNGSLVMKELRAPWIFWHSPQAGINAEALAPDDPLRNDSIFIERVTAERLEREIVRPGIRRWNAARVRKVVDPKTPWRRVRRFFRQVLGDTSVNLASSDSASHLITDTSVLTPPLSFFINRDTLFDTLDLLPDDVDGRSIQIAGKSYRDYLQRYEVHRSDGTIRVAGDVHFAFLTPEPAFEDTGLVAEMLTAGLVSRRFIACLTMVDFPNPVFSAARAHLLQYIPDELPPVTPELPTSKAARLEAQFVEAVRAALSAKQATDDDAEPDPEQEFLSLWDTPEDEYEDAFRTLLSGYFARLKSGMTQPEIVDGWLRLAESRRRLFRKLDLAEFSLTTPVTNIPADAPVLRMSLAGLAVPATEAPPA